jgi:hypothetical protein
LSLKETRLKDHIKRAVPSQQLRSAFWSDSGSPRHFVRRVPAESNKVRHLVWIDAIPFPDLFGPDARKFPAPRGIEDGCTGWGELKGISIAAGHQRGTACALLSGDCGGEKVVCFEPWGFGVGKPKGGDKIGQGIYCQLGFWCSAIGR